MDSRVDTTSVNVKSSNLFSIQFSLLSQKDQDLHGYVEGSFFILFMLHEMGNAYYSYWLLSYQYVLVSMTYY